MKKSHTSQKTEPYILASGNKPEWFGYKKTKTV